MLHERSHGNRRRRIVVACVIGLSLWSAPAWAQGTWDANTTTSGPQDGSGTWSTTNANWWNGTTDVVWATGNATFGTGTAGSGTAGTVTLGSNVTANNITFNAPFSGTYTIDLAGRTLAVSSNGSVNTNANTIISDSVGGGSLSVTSLGGFGINNGALLTVSAKITGSSVLYTGGAGNLTLTNDANDFTGRLGKQNGGTITISSIKNSGVASAAGAGNTVQVGYNSGLQYTGGGDTTNRTLELIGDGVARSATINNSGSGALIWTGSVANTGLAGGTMGVNLNGANTNDNEIQGVFANNGTNVLSITKNNAGKWILSGANTYTGATTVTGGILQIGNGGTTGSLSGSSSISVSSGATLAFSRSNTITQGTDFNSVISGAGNVTKLASGTLVLNGANTYTGTTSVNAGTLQLGESGTTGSLSSSSVITGSSGATLAFNRTDTYGGNLTNTIGGGINLTQLGSGTLTLAGANTYTGTTRISAGSLTLANANALQNSTLDMNSGDAGTLAFGITGTNTYNIGGLIGSRNIATSGSVVLSVGGNASSGTYSGIISGAGAFTKVGAGAVTLTGNNTFSGLTTISGGTLSVGNGGASGALAGNVVNNAALIFNRSDDLTYTGNISGSGGLEKLGSGKLTLTGSHSFAAATTVSAGGLAVNGQLGGNVAVLTGGILGGSGSIGGVLSGAGLVSPGNSPGILTASQFDPAGGLGAAFEFTAFSPAYTNSTASLNDVLRLTNGTPFTNSLGGGNVIDVYFDVDSLTRGDLFEGGFFTTLSAADLLTAVQAATFQYWAKDAGGSTVFNGVNYSSVTSMPGLTGVTLTTANVTRDFGAGAVSGSVTQFVIVPEPGAIVIAGIGLAAAGWTFARRRRQPAAVE